MTIHSEKFGCGPLWVNQQLTKLDKKLLEAQNLNIVNIDSKRFQESKIFS